MNYIGEQTNRSHDMVYRWQQGRLQPNPEQVEILAQIACREADLAREWCEELLLATHYSDQTNLINKLWGPTEARTIPNRLGRMEHTRPIGRQEERKQLQKFLSPRYAAYLITVDGIGEVGKTALARRQPSDGQLHHADHTCQGYPTLPQIQKIFPRIFSAQLPSLSTPQKRAKVTYIVTEELCEILDWLKEGECTCGCRGYQFEANVY